VPSLTLRPEDYQLMIFPSPSFSAGGLLLAFPYFRLPPLFPSMDLPHDRAHNSRWISFFLFSPSAIRRQIHSGRRARKPTSPFSLLLTFFPVRDGIRIVARPIARRDAFFPLNLFSPPVGRIRWETSCGAVLPSFFFFSGDVFFFLSR